MHMTDHEKTIQELTAENDNLKKRIHELDAMQADRKRAEEKLLLIQKAVEDSSDAIGLADAQGNHFYQNIAFTRLLGYTADELKVQGVAQTVYADQAVARDVFETIMQGGSWSGEVEDIAKDGRRLTVMLRADAINGSERGGYVRPYVMATIGLAIRKELER
jgi:PAS domain S-box-containing protein